MSYVSWTVPIFLKDFDNALADLRRKTIPADLLIAIIGLRCGPAPCSPIRLVQATCCYDIDTTTRKDSLMRTIQAQERSCRSLQSDRTGVQRFVSRVTSPTSQYRIHPTSYVQTVVAYDPYARAFNYAA